MAREPEGGFRGRARACAGAPLARAGSGASSEPWHGRVKSWYGRVNPRGRDDHGQTAARSVKSWYGPVHDGGEGGGGGGERRKERLGEQRKVNGGDGESNGPTGGRGYTSVHAPTQKIYV